LSDQTRAFPEQPNLRFLKLEAKRRLAAGEFATLHDAQLAVAREHGLSSWAVLKEFVTAQPGEPRPALAHVQWLVSRFRDADGAGWAPPSGDELREHFTDYFLSVVPPATVTETLTQAAPMLGEELLVTQETELGVRARIGGLQVEAAIEPDLPNRLSGLRVYRLSQHVTDRRVAAEPAVSATGPVPAEAAAVAGESFAELGLPGLALAGAGGAGGSAGPAWSLAQGWASLEPAKALQARHRFPAYSITKLITATVVLRLVAEGRVALDDPANRHLRTVRLADDAVTVRELLTHTGGVASPGELFASTVPELVALAGPVMACPGPRGTFRYSNGGYGMLGQLIADTTGSGYQEAAGSLVLRPLGMTDSFFPGGWPDRDAVTGYELTDDGSFAEVPAHVCTLPAAGGLWASAPDLALFAVAWDSLLPAELAREALRPQASRGAPGTHMGLGWLLHQDKDLAGHAGGGVGAATSLILHLGSGRASVAMTNRHVPIEPVNARLLRPVA